MADTKKTGSFQTTGERLDDFLGEASQRIEKETQLLIDYINDELVPAIRTHSTKAMRVASDKLKQAADKIEADDQHKKK